MTTSTLLLKLTRFVDSEGVEHWVEMKPDVASVLAQLEPRLKERLLRKPGAIAGVAAPSTDLGNAWVGPRLRFRWLVGESRTWAGEPTIEVEGERYCTMCWGLWLPTWAYCLGCDRCGIEWANVAKPRKKARVESRDDGLKGGLEVGK